ncbi:MAG: Hint domain-containing protein [Rhodobacteraceae bacterium]|nr:Hint domain-containing protein [Paracoccaceae bacterium]
MRRYEVAGLTPDGTPRHFARTLAAEPHLDEAFAAFARGTLIATANGPVAVEDLMPGMALMTADAGPRRLMWVGTTQLMPPDDPLHAERTGLTRITADSLGLGRPMPDLVLGPRARMLFRHSGCQALFGTEAGFAPASAFVDGVTLIALRPSRPMSVYHLALEGQHALVANGVEIESYHPGENADALMDAATRMEFLSLFPHLEGFGGFGAMTLPRLTAFELERLRAA